MPLYAYQCRECEYDLEVRQSFSDAPLSECPHCGNPKGLFRVVQPAGVVFKGSGFYVTDSGKKNGANGATNGKNGKHENGHKPESTETAKSESAKPEATKASEPAA